MTTHQALTVALAGLAVFGVVDVIWLKLPDWLTAAFFAGILVVSGNAASPTGILHGALAAVIVGLIYLELGTFGIFGGGDVKLSVAPAFALGVIQPVLALWWLVMSISIQGTFSLANRHGRIETSPAALALPHVPAMFAAFLIAWCAATVVA